MSRPIDELPHEPEDQESVVNLLYGKKSPTFEQYKEMNNTYKLTCVCRIFEYNIFDILNEIIINESNRSIINKIILLAIKNCKIDILEFIKTNNKIIYSNNDQVNRVIIECETIEEVKKKIEIVEFLIKEFYYKFNDSFTASCMKYGRKKYIEGKELWEIWIDISTELGYIHDKEVIEYGIKYKMY